MRTAICSVDHFTVSSMNTGNDVINGEGVHLFNATAVGDGVIESAPVGVRCVNLSISGGAAASMSGTYVAFRVAVDVYLVGALCIAGLLGNALSIVVLYRDGRNDAKRNTTNLLLQMLAIVDTLYLASCVAIQCAKTAHDLTDWAPGKSVLRRYFPYIEPHVWGHADSVLSRSFSYIEPHVWGLASIAQTSTVWIVLLVTIDRYLAVCHPWLTEWRTKSRAKIAVFVVVALAGIYNIPRFFERKIVYQQACDSGETIVRSQKTAFRDNVIYFVVYKTICYFLFRSVGPLVTLVALNVRLVRALQTVGRRRRDMTARRLAVAGPDASLAGARGTERLRRREGLTLMLVIVVTVFVICELPDLGLRVAFTMHETGYVRVDVVRLRWANVISNALLTVNSSVNFLIYCLVGKKFRRILSGMCCAKAALTQIQRETTGAASMTAYGGDFTATAARNNHRSVRYSVANAKPEASPSRQAVHCHVEQGQRSPLFVPCCAADDAELA